MALSGKEMLALYKKAGWMVKRKKGSHFIIGKGLKRETIPMHKELRTGLEKKL